MYTGGAGGYYYRSRYRGWIWGSIGVILVVSVVVAVSCSVTLSKEEDEEKRFTPGDTRIKRFDNFFCSGIKASTSYDFGDQDAKAYVIQNNPPLTARNNLSFDDAFTLYEDDYHYWHFYLYKGSNISLEGCITSGSGYWFYIVKSTAKWNDWKDYASSSKAVFDDFITSSCDNMAQGSFKVQSSDHYYIAYYNDYDSAVSGRQTLRVNRFEYSEPSDSNLPNCSFAGPSGRQSCELKVPLFSEQSKILVRLPSVDESRAEESFHLDLDCIPRPVAYVIVIVPSVVFMLLVLCSVLLCCYCYFNARKKQYQPLLKHEEIPVQPSLTNGSVHPPPPFNPGFAPPPYSTP